jgi:hypothetical protein
MRLRMMFDNLLNLFVGLVEAILALRFVLKLFGANSGNSFVSWVYDMSGVLLQPFRGIFPAKVFENKYVLEFSTLFAMLMFAALALLVVGVVNMVTAPAVAKKR